MHKSNKSARFVSKTAAIYQTGFEVQIPLLFAPTSSSSTRVIDIRALGHFKTHNEYDTGKRTIP